MSLIVLTQYKSRCRGFWPLSPFTGGRLVWWSSCGWRRCLFTTRSPKKEQVQNTHHHINESLKTYDWWYRSYVLTSSSSYVVDGAGPMCVDPITVLVGPPVRRPSRRFYRKSKEKGQTTQFSHSQYWIICHIICAFSSHVRLWSVDGHRGHDLESKI